MPTKKKGILDRIAEVSANVLYGGKTKTPISYTEYGFNEEDDPNSSKFRRKHFKPPNNVDTLRVELKNAGFKTEYAESMAKKRKRNN